MNTEKLKESFLKLYGSSEEKINLYFAPGRVNLIGEHTDYNSGYVFPCSLTYGTYLMIREQKENAVDLTTMNYSYHKKLKLPEIEKDDENWVNYPMGVMKQFQEKGFEIPGCQMLFAGDVPDGAGLSSSASIEMATAVCMNDILGSDLPMLELVKLSQKAENVFVGVNCGIMDQFAAGFGKKDHAVFINCGTLEHELVPVRLKDHLLIISNTNLKRGLTTSKYNERRSQCESAVEYLSQKDKIENLSRLNLSAFHQSEHLIKDETVKKRARHVISENQRVLEAVDALKNNDLPEFGRLMLESHESLKKDYEVTGPELDALVEEAMSVEGVVGSRMTGAGFGGCTVSIVRKNATDQFKVNVGQGYKKKTGLDPDFYIGNIGDGAMKIR